MPDDVLDWRTEAHHAGVHHIHVWNTLRQAWPRNSMWNYPYSPAHIDQLATQPEHHRAIRQAIHDTATDAKAHT